MLVRYRRHAPLTEHLTQGAGVWGEDSQNTTSNLGPHGTEGSQRTGAESQRASPVQKVMVRASVYPIKWPLEGVPHSSCVPSVHSFLSLLISNWLPLPRPIQSSDHCPRISCSQSATPDQQHVHPLGTCQKCSSRPVPEPVTFQE